MCVNIATIFVPSAKSKSEPIAVSVRTPRKIKRGVVMAPAPTPLYAIQVPTMKPTRIKFQLIVIALNVAPIWIYRSLERTWVNIHQDAGLVP